MSYTNLTAIVVVTLLTSIAGFVKNNTVGTITLADNVNKTLVGNCGTLNTGVGSKVNFETGSSAKDVASTTAAVVKAEESKLQDDVDAAKTLVDALADSEKKLHS